LDEDILPRLSLPRGVPGTISTLTKYFIIIIGFLIASSSIGLDLNRFTILIGALGVGIGFGLQDLVNNFISGLILIFERPIQVGDVVHFNDIEGRVTNIGIRSSRIKTWQGSEIIVPNGHLVSNDVINWTFSDKMRRIEIKVGVEYGCDVDQIKELLLGCAKADERIISNPEPMVIFRDFGESSLDFELRCWTNNFDLWFTISSELRFAINKTFEENNITIPFPQRDIYIKTPKKADLLEEKKPEEQNEKDE
jgi:small-conductance mechanosensitive channel